MTDFVQFLQMGGYASFVWPSYAITLGVLVLNIIWARSALRRAREEARRRLAQRAQMDLTRAQRS